MVQIDILVGLLCVDFPGLTTQDTSLQARGHCHLIGLLHLCQIHGKPGFLSVFLTDHLVISGHHHMIFSHMVVLPACGQHKSLLFHLQIVDQVVICEHDEQDRQDGQDHQIRQDKSPQKTLMGLQRSSSHMQL